MAESPKLYTNKPRKGRSKPLEQQQQQQQPKAKDFSSPASASPSASASASTSSTMEAHSSAPPPQPPKESFARRYKFLWPLLLTVNLAVGAYLFMRTKKKDTDIEEEAANNVHSAPVSTAATPTTGKPSPSLPVMQPVKVIEPIPKDQQLELFKWVLEEKRKVKPKNADERKRVDEEKAILKQFIRAKSIPNI